MLQLAMKNVMYLRELRIVLMEKMLAEFVAGVDVYLTQVKGASQDDAKKYQVNERRKSILKSISETFHKTSAPYKRVLIFNPCD